MKPFILTVDTEPDDSDWRGLNPRSLSFASLKGLRRFGELAREFDLKPTLLVTHSVAAQPEFEPLLRETGLRDVCEIGAHLHPADTPPFSGAGERSDNLMRVPDDLLEEKFAHLHGELTRRFGAPRSFRGGAWALDARMIRLLKRYGYAVDSTVTPGVSWVAKRRPSYLGAPMRAYPLHPENPCAPGDSGLLEIPVSILPGKRPPPWLAAGRVGSLATMPLHSRRGPLMPLWRRLRPRAPVWLRPAFTPLAEMGKAAAGLEGTGYLHGMIHSNELWPGTSPYAGDESECEAVFARLRGLCRLALERGYRPMTLLEAAAALPPAAAA